MQLKYGAFAHASNEAQVVISRSPMRNQGGQVYGYRESWKIDGMILANDTNTLQSLVNGLKVGYSRQAQDIGLFYDNGNVTNHFLLTSRCAGGTIVTDGPTFPHGEGVEVGTVRTYSITVEGEVLDPSIQLLAFTESITFEGGGPLIVHLQTLNGLPQKQQTAENVPFTCTQEGEAVGLLAYPTIPGPLFPDRLKIAPQIRRKTPKRRGPPGAPFYTDFECSWKYLFEDAAPMAGNPNRWI